ncbi:MAG: hypothetical protein ACYC09_08585 [Bacteroidota bacterium]
MFGKNFWIAVIVGGIVVNVMDFLVHGMLFAKLYYSAMEGMRTDTNPMWFVVLDFIMVMVFVWFYDKVRSVFGGGMQGGMRFGFYYGVALSFPVMFFPYLMYQGMNYSFVWVSIIYGIIWGMILGMVVGKSYTAGSPASAQ